MCVCPACVYVCVQPSFSNMDPGGVDCSPCLVEITRSPPLCRVCLVLLNGSMMCIVGCYVGQAVKLTRCDLTTYGLRLTYSQA